MAEKILIVDDDVDSLRLIAMMLQRHGYEVGQANSGNQALSKAEAEKPNLIILDVMMPDMNGLEVCRRLRANPNTNKIPIIMFTAKTLIDDKVKGFEAGADDYLTKPTHPAELASRVKAILARSAAKQAEAAGGAAVPSLRQRPPAIGVIGAKGGVGTTTVALNLASALLQQGETPVVADFCLGVGSLGLLIGAGRSQSMARILSKPAKEITAQAVQGELASHQSGLRALVSSARPKEAQLHITVESAMATVNAVRALARPAIFDLGHGLNAITSKIQADLEKLIMVVEPNSVTLAMAREIIQDIEAESGGGRINVVVVNRAQSSLQTPWHEVENILGRDVKAIISAAPELAFQATENKMPMVLLQPTAIVSGQFIKLAEDMKSRIKSIAGGPPQ